MSYLALVVDDDPTICQAVASAIERYEFDVLAATNTDEARQKIESNDIDLLLLDIGLPGQSGTDFCRELQRRDGWDTPVVFLTGHDADIDRIVGLEIGADDYITKPFHPGVLLARLRTVLRRVTREAAKQEAATPRSEYRLEVVPTRYDATYDGEPLDLTVTEFKLLTTLMHRAGQAYSREQLKEGAYGPGVYVSDKTINSHINRIKCKIAGLGPDPIESVRGIGYRIDVSLIQPGDQ